MSKSSKLLTQAGSIAALCFMFVAFQNCGKQMQFAPSDGFEFKDAHIIAVEDDSIDGGSIDDKKDDDTVADNGGDDQDIVAPPTGDNTEDDEPVVTLPPEENGENDNDDNNDDDVVVDNSGDTRYVCILDGPGKSLKLAVIANSLSAENSSAHVICVTQNGCLNIASQKFTVKEAVENRGYCKNEGSRAHVSDSQLQELLSNSN